MDILAPDKYEELKILKEESRAVDLELAGYLIVEFKVLDGGLVAGKCTPPSGLPSRRFLGLDELLLFMWDNADYCKFPVCEDDLRSFSSVYPSEEQRKKTALEREAYWKQYDKVKSSVISVIRQYYRNHTSIQGRISIGNQSMNFRSALELMNLLRTFIL